jgi:hypothetical protein
MEFAGKARYFVIEQRLCPPVHCVVVRNENGTKSSSLKLEK